MIGRENNAGLRPEVDQKLRYSVYEPDAGYISKEGYKPLVGLPVVYFGGTFEEPDSKSTKDIKQWMANYTGQKCYSFLPTENPKNVVQILKANGVKEYISAGYSQGSIRSIESEKLLQSDNDIKLMGHILMEPTALYSQDNLSKNFLMQAPKTAKEFVNYRKIRKERLRYGYDQEMKNGYLTEKELNKKYRKLGRKQRIEDMVMFLKKGFPLAIEIVSLGIPKLMGINGKDKPNMKSQIADMSQLNPLVKEIKAPVVIIQGRQDSVSDPSKVEPSAVFKNSQKVVRVVPDHLSTHAIEVFRSKQIAHATLLWLNRYKKYRSKFDNEEEN